VERKWIAAKMVNVQCPVMMVRIVAKRMEQKWIAAKMVSARCPVMMVRIAAKSQRNNSKINLL
jgi:hypothetical protein